MSVLSKFNNAMRSMFGSALQDVAAQQATQEEMQAGTNINIRSMSPLNISQAIKTHLVSGTGLLQGHTDAGSAAQPPTQLQLSFASDMLNIMGDFVITINNGNNYHIYLSPNDPSQTYWVDTSESGYSGGGDVAARIAELLGGYLTGAYAPSVTGSTVTFPNPDTGATAESFITGTVSGMTVAGGGNGVDAVMPSGAITEVAIIPQDGAKTIKPISIYALGDGVDALIEVSIKSGGDYYPLTSNLPNNYSSAMLQPGSFYEEWINGRASASLVARMLDTAPVGGSQRFLAIVKQS